MNASPTSFAFDQSTPDVPLRRSDPDTDDRADQSVRA